MSKLSCCFHAHFVMLTSILKKVVIDFYLAWVYSQNIVNNNDCIQIQTAVKCLPTSTTGSVVSYKHADWFRLISNIGLAS